MVRSDSNAGARIGENPGNADMPLNVLTNMCRF